MVLHDDASMLPLSRARTVGHKYFKGQKVKPFPPTETMPLTPKAVFKSTVWLFKATLRLQHKNQHLAALV